MDKTLQLTIEVFLYFCTVMVQVVTSFVGVALIMITLMIIGKKISKDESPTLKQILFACVIGNPIGILSSMALRDMYHYPDSVCWVFGCVVALSAENILTGAWQAKIFDALLEKLKR